MKDSKLEVREFGGQLAFLRKERQMSQLSLSLDADVSARHLSFLETGRSAPTREMIAKLSDALGISAIERSKLMRAAGFWEWQPNPAGAERRVDGHCAGDLDVILAIDTAADAEQAIAVAAKHLMSIGLGHFFTGTMQGHNCSGAIAITHHHVSHAPLGWMLHYRDCGYQSIDPLVKATGKRHLSFFWSDLSQSQPFQQEGVRRMFDEGREFRITNGFVMPLHRADGTVHALSAMAEDIDIDNPHIRAKAKAVSVALLHRLDAFGMTTIAQSLDVDDCERDCLSRILEGRTSDELARRMSLDEQSAIQLVSRVCAKFGTTDPLEAALRARRSKLICL